MSIKPDPCSFQDDLAAGKETNWWELEISGLIRNISPSIWKLTHLTALYLNDNCLSRLPSAIGLLVNLRRLDLANNKLRYLARLWDNSMVYTDMILAA